MNETLRYIQYGSIHGSAEECGSSNFPAIFVRLTEPDVYDFIMSLGSINGNLTYQATKKGINSSIEVLKCPIVLLSAFSRLASSQLDSYLILSFFLKPPVAGPFGLHAKRIHA